MRATSPLKRAIVATFLGCAAGAQAQYARPGAVVPARPSASTAVTVPASVGVRPGAVATGPTSPFCFEVIDSRDSALISALNANGLLCPTVAKTGAPVRLRATPNGDLTGEDSGTPTALHRMR